MQALGAYGFLGLKKGLKAFLQHIPAGLHHLHRAATQVASLPPPPGALPDMPEGESSKRDSCFVTLQL